MIIAIAYLASMTLCRALAALGLMWAYLPLYALLEPIKRLLSPFIYPVAWLFRHRLRARDKENPRLWAKLWEPYLFKPTFRPLWWFLDDSLQYSQGKEYDDKEKRYPGWIWKLAGGEDPEPSQDNTRPESFLKAWWWSAFRNSMVNWNNSAAHSVGFHVSSIPKTRPAVGGFYEVHVYDTGKKRPYWEFRLFGFWFQIGWLRGNKESNGASRFEIDLFKRK